MGGVGALPRSRRVNRGRETATCDGWSMRTDGRGRGGHGPRGAGMGMAAAAGCSMRAWWSWRELAARARTSGTYDCGLR